MLPVLIAIGAMKLLLMKLAIKKLAIITAMTFLLSKTSFILSGKKYYEINMYLNDN